MGWSAITVKSSNLASRRRLSRKLTLISMWGYQKASETKGRHYPAFAREVLSCRGAGISGMGTGGKRCAASALDAGEQRVAGGAVPGQQLLVIVLQHLHLEVRREQRPQLCEAHRHHRVFVVPDLGFVGQAPFDAQPERLPFALAAVVPAGAEAQQVVAM